MPYTICTYEHDNMGACSIQYVLDVVKTEDKQQFLDYIETWDCILGKRYE